MSRKPGWPWASTMPGITVLPASETRVAAAGAATSPRRPTRVMRLPSIKKAESSIGAAPSPLMSRAPSNRVAVWARAGGAAAAAIKSPAENSNVRRDVRSHMERSPRFEFFCRMGGKLTPSRGHGHGNVVAALWVAPRRLSSGGSPMPRVVGIDHLVLSVGDFARSRDFYRKVLGFLGFKLKYDYPDYAGWKSGNTRFWIAEADAEGKEHKHRKGDIGFHHYAFELASRKDVDDLGAFLEKNDINVVDPAGEYNGDKNYYAVFFTDPDGMKLEGMFYKPRPKAKKAARKPKKQARKRRT